jgi:hypothetical protein
MARIGSNSHVVCADADEELAMALPTSDEDEDDLCPRSPVEEVPQQTIEESSWVVVKFEVATRSQKGRVGSSALKFFTGQVSEIGCYLET